MHCLRSMSVCPRAYARCARGTNHQAMYHKSPGSNVDPIRCAELRPGPQSLIARICYFRASCEQRYLRIRNNHPSDLRNSSTNLSPARFNNGVTASRLDMGCDSPSLKQVALSNYPASACIPRRSASIWGHHSTEISQSSFMGFMIITERFEEQDSKVG